MKKDNPGAAPPGGVESVNRALVLLACFREGDDALSLAQLAERSGFYKSTILRLTVSLEAAGFLIRHADKSFTIGPEVLRLGAVYQKALRMEDVVRPVLKRVLEVLGESASFFRREGETRVCAFREDSSRSIRDHVMEGETLPLAAGAAGRVLLDFAPQETAPGELRRRAAMLPYTSFGERDPEIAAVAVPVYGRRQGRLELAGALAISGPIGRFDRALIACAETVLLDEGRALSARLGGSYEGLGLSS